jgi:hypothetical protein
VFYTETVTEPKPAGFRQPFPEETCAVTADSTPDFVTAGFSYLFFVIFPVLSNTVSGLQCRKGVDLERSTLPRLGARSRPPQSRSAPAFSGGRVSYRFSWLTSVSLPFPGLWIDALNSSEDDGKVFYFSGDPVATTPASVDCLTSVGFT